MSRNDSSCCRKVSTFVCSVVFAGLVFAMILAAPRAGITQVLYGTLVGHVADPSGAAVPGAKVTIINQGTTISTQATTNSSGDYTFSTIVAGTYTLQIAQQGFQTYKRTDVPVTINAVQRADITLTLGAVTQTVEVTGAQPILQTDTSEVHANIDTPTLTNLPVPLGRNYQQIYRAEPGFSPPVNNHSYPTNPARSLSFNVNGTSNNQNNTQIDGVSTYNVQLPHVNSYVPTLDSIQQVNVATDSFEAEQGFAGGAAINVETKSGTNQIHGDVFEYHNNNHLKAWPDLFDGAGDNVGNKPKYIYNDFGGSVGGPIVKNKLFFFGSYEGLFNNFYAQTFQTVPTQAMRNGDLSDSGTDIYDPMTGNADGSGRTQFFATNDPNDTAHFNAACASAQCLNMIPTSRLDPIAQHILSFVPLPDRGGVKRDFFTNGDRVFHRNQVDTKINYNVNSKMNLIGTFGMLHYINITPTAFGVAGGGPAFGQGGNPGKGYGNTYRMTIMGTYTFSPNFLMDAHFGWAKQGTSSVQNDLGTNIGSDVLGIPGTNGTRSFETGWPEFDMDGFSTIGQVDNFMPYYRHDPQKQIVGNFNWIKGPHSVRFGVNWYTQTLNQTQAEDLSGGYGSQGGFNFGQGVTANCTSPGGGGACNGTTDTSRDNAIASLLLGLPDTMGRNFQIPEAYHERADLYSLYVQDRWNVNKNLTLNYGLRWEYYPMPTRPDLGRGIEVYQPSNNTMELCGFGSVPSGCGVEISKKLFSPRVGFAYRLSDTFVIRAGYGLTVDPYEAMEPNRNNFPISVPTHDTNTLPAGGKGGLLPSGSLATGVPAIATPNLGNGIIPVPLDVAFAGYPSKKFDRGYVQSWNLTLQKELKWGFTGQVGYVATRQTRLLGFLDTNAGQVIGAGSAGQPLFAKYGRTAPTINIVPVGSGHYDSLQAVLSRRFTGGLMLQVNYTYSKAISNIDNSDGSPGDEKLQIFNLMNLNQTVTDYDRTQNLQILHVWELPFGKGKRWLSSGGVGSAIVGGWQLSGLASFLSGPPFSIYSNGNGFNTPGSNQTADQVKSTIQKIGTVDPNAFFYDPFAFANPDAARLGTTGYNLLRAPGAANYDFSVQRMFNLTERFKLQFRMDAFNFTNTPHFAAPDNTLSDANAFDPVTHVVTDPGSFMTVSGVQDLAREGIDERQFEFSLKLSF
ncbi:MAG TPA: TonB-dependent receptor [Terriglobia bacterium]|nr:TonB-dependent receptor [Terriglobia bacterium]